MYAIILAGGEGTRLRPLTNDKPKPMVEIGGLPILEHQIRQLKKAGIRDVVVCESYLPEIIQTYFGDGEKFGVHIAHLTLPKKLNSAGAIKKGFDAVPDNENDVLVLYGDIISNIDFSEVSRQHVTKHAFVTAVTTKFNSPYGEWEVDDGRTTSFREKPEKNTNTGVMVLNRGITDFLVEGKDFSRGVLEPLARHGGSVFQIYNHKGFWRDIADIKNLHEAEESMIKWEIPISHPEGHPTRIEGK